MGYTYRLQRRLPIGVSMLSHFTELTLNMYEAIIAEKVNKVEIASDLLTIISFSDIYKAKPLKKITGPYEAGTLRNIKVIVTPDLKPGEFKIGDNLGIIKDFE